jgi:hypothetical protein
MRAKNPTMKAFAFKILKKCNIGVAIGLTGLFCFTVGPTKASAELIPISVWPTNTVLSSGSGASYEVGMSPDGRFVLFTSSANNLVTNHVAGSKLNLFLRDRSTGRTTLVSASTNGNSGGNGISIDGSMTPDGRFVAFESGASDLVAGDANGVNDIFLRDLQTRTTELVSHGAGVAANSQSSVPRVSSNGQWVAFESTASNLVTGDLNALSDIFVYDAATKQISLVSAGTAGTSLPGAESHSGQITANGKAVIFWSKGTNLVNGSPSQGDVYYRDLAAQQTYWVSTNALTILKSVFPAVKASDVSISEPVVTSDGRYIAFKILFSQLSNNFLAVQDMTTFTTRLIATNAVPAIEQGSPNLSISNDGKRVAYAGGNTNVYVWDADTASTILVSVNSGGTGPANGGSDAPEISADGSKVVFESDALDVVEEGTDGVQLYVRDLLLNSTVLVNIGMDSFGEDLGGNAAPAVSADGRYVSFHSLSGLIVAGDENDDYDVFVRDVMQGRSELISASASSGMPGIAPGTCADCQNVVSDDGRFVVFESSADLTSIPVFGTANVYRRDVVNHTTLLVSVSSDGLRGANLPCSGVTLSGDGNVVAFVSASTNLTTHIPSAQRQIFVRNISSNSTILTSVNVKGLRSNADSSAPSIDRQGDKVLFSNGGSSPSDLVNPPVRAGTFVRDFTTGTTSAVGQSSIGGRITSDGLYAGAFDQTLIRVTDLTLGTFTNYPGSSFIFSHNSRYFVTATIPNPTATIIVRDLLLGTDTTITQNLAFASISDDARLFAGFSVFRTPAALYNPVTYDAVTQQLTELPLHFQHTQSYPLLSPNGRFIAYETVSSTADTANDTNSFSDVALYDLQLKQLRLISVSGSTGFAADSLSIPMAVLNDGSVVFESFADDLFAGTPYGVGSMYLFRNTLTDSDHDGLDDLLEMSLYGSLDTQGGSVGFRILSLSSMTGGAAGWTITWEAQDNARYQVEYKHSLGDANWTAASGVITAADGAQSLSYSDTANNGADALFYRVVQLP